MIAVTFLLLLLFSLTQTLSVDTLGSLLKENFIWHPNASPGSYVAFRRQFTPTSSLTSARLALFADSRYILYVNGKRLSTGPERFDWRGPTYDVIDISSTLSQGVTNSIVVLSHNYDTCEGAQAPNNMPEVCIVANPGTWWLDTPSGRFMNHVPGFSLALFNSETNEVILTTDTTNWRSTISTRYGRSRPVWASIPDNIDGRVDNGDPSWERTEFDDSSWSLPISIDGSQWGPLTRRIIPNLKYTPVSLTLLGDSPSLTLIGDSLPSDRLDTPSEYNNHDHSEDWPIILSETNPSIILDASTQVLASYSIILANASAPGLILSLTWFERFNQTTRILSHSYTTSTYITAGNLLATERFETSDVFGGRYILLSLSSPPPTGQGGLPLPLSTFSVTLLGVNATDVRYPFELVASFDVPDEPFFAKLFAMAAATISINSADSYTDCSTRERAEWLGDTVINLYNASRLAFATLEDDGTTTYADPRLLRGALTRALLSSRSFYPNFFEVKAHTASDRQDFNAVWTDYTFALVTALKRYLDVTGDTSFVKSIYPDTRSQLLNILSRIQLSSGLGLFRETIFFTDPLFLDLTCGTTLNSFAFAALVDGAGIASTLAYNTDASLFSQTAELLRAALINKSWNSSSSLPAFNAAYPSDAAIDGTTWTGPGGNLSIVQAPSSYANFIALAKGVLDLDTERAADAITYLCSEMNNPLVQAAAPMAAIQQLSALFNYGGSSTIDKVAIDVIRTNWAAMVNATDVGTLWEFFDESGEVSHNMGAAPLPFLLEHVLGVTTTLPISPDHRLITIEPHLGDIYNVNGVAVSEFGPVGVSWKISNGSWVNGGNRAVDLTLNVSIAQILPLPARSPSTATSVNVSIAFPLSDAYIPPPSSASSLSTCCLELSTLGRALNVSQALENGELTLDKDRRYLRYFWNVVFSNDGKGEEMMTPPHWLGGPALNGLQGTDSMIARLSSPSGGC